MMAVARVMELWVVDNNRELSDITRHIPSLLLRS